MKLYYTPRTSSLFPHIILREAGLEFELIKVDEHTKLTEDGRDYRGINPLGYVPALELADGTTITEGVAISQYVADQVRERLRTRLAHIERHLTDREHMLGEQFSLADAYIYVVLNWSRAAAVDLLPFPFLLALRKRVAARPAVQAALKAEGLASSTMR